MGEAVETPRATPSFVAWAIEYQCPLKLLSYDSGPLSIERTLRPIRAWSRATRAGRNIDGICLAPGQLLTIRDQQWDSIWGFSEQEILEPFGGANGIGEQCDGCPANAQSGPTTRRSNNPAESELNSDPRGPESCLSGQREEVPRAEAAGCFGWFPVTGPTHDLVSIHQTVVDDLTSHFDQPSPFLATDPSWFGLWSEPVIRDPAVLHRLLDLTKSWVSCLPKSESTAKQSEWSNGPSSRGRSLEATQIFVEPIESELARFQDALDRCLRHSLSLQVKLLPAGLVRGRKWFVAAHCSQCSFPMDSGDRRCGACGKLGGPHPATKRCALGIRPFIPLKVWCSHETIASVCERLLGAKRPDAN